MDENKDELVKGLDDIEITELDDKDLEDVSGGTTRIDDGGDGGGGNTNCGCNGQTFTGGSGNENCGC